MITHYSTTPIDKVELTQFTGGISGCLDFIDGNLLKNGDRAVVIKDVGGYIIECPFRLNSTSGVTPDGIKIIIPIINSGLKRWESISPFIVYGLTEPTDNLDGNLIWIPQG